MKKLQRMRKIFRTLSAALAACLLAAALAGCMLDVQPPDPLEGGEQNAIVAAYIAQTKEDLRAESAAAYREDAVTFEAYYGTFGQCVVFSLHDDNFGYTQAIVEVEVGGVYICTNPSGEANPRVYLAESGRITSLQNAYEEELLTRADLRAVAANIRAAQSA